MAIPAPADRQVSAGEPVIVIEAMKMEHEIVAEQDGVSPRCRSRIGETVTEGQPLVVLDARRRPRVSRCRHGRVRAASPDPRADLHAVHERHEIGLDHRRPDAVASATTRTPHGA